MWKRLPGPALAAAILLPAAVLLPTAIQAQQAPLYKNPDAPLEQRVNDLISRMTLEEKVSQIMNDAPAIPRLGVPAYNWWNESLHGVARAGRATVFPQAIGIAATWDTDLMTRIATVISDEARAKHHEFLRQGKHDIYQGLTFWTPNINIFRDPRWGRGMETYGEDPYLTGQMAVAFIKAMQGDDPKYLKTIATAKHFAVHSGPEPLRHTFDAVVSDRDLFTTYLPQFEAAVRQGGAWSVMCAYNSVDGLPACSNPRLLQQILRDQWGFQGYVVSDCGAIGDIYLRHRKSPNAAAGVAAAIKAGTDLNCGIEFGAALDSVRQGLLAESDIDASLRRLFTARFKLGEFDPPGRVPYASIPYQVLDSPAHRQVALEAARKSIVLLKNENNTLPLSKTLGTIAVIGPSAHDTMLLYGNYNGIPADPITPLEGIRRKVGATTRVVYAQGTDLAENMPTFEVIPYSALFTGNGPNRQNGITGAYYASSNFDGNLHRPRELTVPTSGQLVGEIPPNPQPLFTRVDARVDFDWLDGAPRGLPGDDFGVRWTGYLQAPVTGTYQIGAAGKNAFELYLDGRQLTRQNSIHGARTYLFSPVELEAGRLYQVRLDFHEYLNDAAIQLVWSRPNMVREQDALDAARAADAVVMVMGLSPRLEGEEMRVPVQGFQGGDRLTLDLPGVQQDLMRKIAALGKPTVLVLLNGSAVAVNWANDNLPAIVEAWYPGQAGGDALADVLFGDYNPAGRLPVTFYKSVDQLPPFTDYSMANRTYRYFTGQPLYPFGYGLSYTTFGYSNLSVPPRVQSGENITVRVEVRNTGRLAGEEVVQIYLRDTAGGPLRTLVGFDRIALDPQQSRTVEFTITPAQIAAVTASGQAAAGSFEIQAGALRAPIRIIE